MTYEFDFTRVEPHILVNMTSYSLRNFVCFFALLLFIFVTSERKKNTAKIDFDPLSLFVLRSMRC